MSQLAAARKRMPMVPVEHDDRFEGPDGMRSLAELFEGRSQLILDRFFFKGRLAGRTDVPWCTIATERFSADFGVTEWFGLNVFLRDGDDIYRTYFLQNGPMVQKIGSVWSEFSLTPYGGQGEDEDVPDGWPQPWSFWFRRHDEFDEPPPSAS